MRDVILSIVVAVSFIFLAGSSFEKEKGLSIGLTIIGLLFLLAAGLKLKGVF
jgi:hypothetical protein